MSIVDKLFGWLNARVWKIDPVGGLALRLRCDGSNLTWMVENHILQTTPVGGSAKPLTVDLAQYTIGSLAYLLAVQPGYTVLYVDAGGLVGLSALALYDQAGDVAASNGDHIFAFTNPNWAIIGAFARELWAAEVQIEQMLLQMVIQTALGEWLDRLGSYYAASRLVGETDATFAPRIIPPILLPKGNNVAIANVIQAVLGQPARVVDVVAYTPIQPLYDGSIQHDGSHLYNSAAQEYFGLFDITIGQDLLGAGLPIPTATLRALIDQVRDAGTQLRSLTGTPSVVSDTASMPSTEAPAMTVVTQTLHNGLHAYDGQVTYAGSVSVAETWIG